MKTVLRLLCTALLGALFFVALPSSPASADNGCPGDWDVRSDYIKDVDGNRVARLYGYDTDNGRCYSLISEGRYRGVSKYMSLTVCNSGRDACTNDTGTFTTWAGGLRRGFICAWTISIIKDPSDRTILRLPTYFGSCD